MPHTVQCLPQQRISCILYWTTNHKTAAPRQTQDVGRHAHHEGSLRPPGPYATAVTTAVEPHAQYPSTTVGMLTPTTAACRMTTVPSSPCTHNKRGASLPNSSTGIVDRYRPEMHAVNANANKCKRAIVENHGQKAALAAVQCRQKQRRPLLVRRARMQTIYYLHY